MEILGRGARMTLQAPIYRTVCTQNTSCTLIVPKYGLFAAFAVSLLSSCTLHQIHRFLYPGHRWLSSHTLHENVWLNICLANVCTLEPADWFGVHSQQRMLQIFLPHVIPPSMCSTFIFENTCPGKQRILILYDKDTRTGQVSHVWPMLKCSVPTDCLHGLTTIFFTYFSSFYQTPYTHTPIPLMTRQSKNSCSTHFAPILPLNLSYSLFTNFFL